MLTAAVSGRPARARARAASPPKQKPIAAARPSVRPRGFEERVEGRTTALDQQVGVVAQRGDRGDDALTVARDFRPEQVAGQDGVPELAVAQGLPARVIVEPAAAVDQQQAGPGAVAGGPGIEESGNVLAHARRLTEFPSNI